MNWRALTLADADTAFSRLLRKPAVIAPPDLSSQ